LLDLRCSGSDAPIVTPYRLPTHCHRQKCTRLDAALPRERVRSLPHFSRWPMLAQPGQEPEAIQFGAARHPSVMPDGGSSEEPSTLRPTMTGRPDCMRFDPLLPSTQRNALATANPQIDRDGHLTQ
jgi:hypothetical protein